jgi:hypothetical protein
MPTSFGRLGYAVQHYLDAKREMCMGTYGSKAIALLVFSASLSGYGSVAWADSYIPVSETLAECIRQGYKPDESVRPTSGLKNSASLVGLAYINYVYQNDTKNPHFCESMLRMDRQVSSGTPGDYKNKYVELFSQTRAQQTMKHLAEIQLAFDYSIGRSSPPPEKIEAAIKALDSILR